MLINTRDDVRLLFYAFLLVSLILSLQYIMNYEYYSVGYRSDEGLERATWSNPNIFGLTIGCGGVLAGAYLTNQLKIERNVITLIMSIVTLSIVIYVLIINASRGAFLIFAMVLLIMMLCSQIKNIYII